MNLKHFLTLSALLLGYVVSAQPTEWNVQYIKQKEYGSPSAFNPLLNTCGSIQS